MNLEDFVKNGMLKRLNKERRFFEDSSPEKEIYCIIESKGDENYEFLYVTKKVVTKNLVTGKAERIIEPITPHLNDNYVGTIDNLSEILLKRMKTILNSKLHRY